MKVKVKVIRGFNDLSEKKLRNVGETFECNMERAEFLEMHKVVEIMEHIKEAVIEETIDDHAVKGELSNEKKVELKVTKKSKKKK